MRTDVEGPLKAVAHPAGGSGWHTAPASSLPAAAGGPPEAGSRGPPGAATGGMGPGGAGRAPGGAARGPDGGAGAAGTAGGGGAGPAAAATGTAAARAIILCRYAADSVFACFDTCFPGIYGEAAVGFPKSGKGPTSSISMP